MPLTTGVSAIVLITPLNLPTTYQLLDGLICFLWVKKMKQYQNKKIF